MKARHIIAITLLLFSLSTKNAVANSEEKAVDTNKDAKKTTVEKKADNKEEKPEGTEKAEGSQEPDEAEKEVIQHMEINLSDVKRLGFSRQDINGLKSLVIQGPAFSKHSLSTAMEKLELNVDQAFEINKLFKKSKEAQIAQNKKFRELKKQLQDPKVNDKKRKYISKEIEKLTFEAGMGWVNDMVGLYSQLTNEQKTIFRDDFSGVNNLITEIEKKKKAAEEKSKKKKN